MTMSYNHIHLTAGFLEAHGGGQGNGAAYAAAYHADPLHALGVGGLAQGAYEVLDVVTLVQGA